MALPEGPRRRRRSATPAARKRRARTATRRVRLSALALALICIAAAAVLAATDGKAPLVAGPSTPLSGSPVADTSALGESLTPPRHHASTATQAPATAPATPPPAKATPTPGTVQRAAPVIPPPAASPPHVMVIVEENKGYAATLGTCSADPYYCSLASTYATATSWYGISHPSAPNYVAMVSGATQGVSSDCTPPSCGPFNVPSLGGQLTAAGIPWRAYMESMPTPCSTGGTAGLYAEKHNPFMYFSDVRSASNCATVDVPYPGAGGLVAALTGPAAPDFVWITPNLANDMHNGSVTAGDAWLKANLAPVLTSSWFAGANATVIVTMDENDAQSTPGGGQIPMVVISSSAHGAGAVATPGNHYGMLRSIEEEFGLGVLGGAATIANGDLTRLFGGPQ